MSQLAGESRIGWLHRVDARLKLLGTLVLLGMVLASSRTVFPVSIFACCIILALSGGAPTRILARRLAAPLAVAGLLGVLRLFNTGSTPLFTVYLLGGRLVATHEGLHAALLIAARVLGGVGAVVLLASSTPAWTLLGALRQLRIPRLWVQIALMMYRQIFDLLEQARTVRAAQRVRLGYVGRRRSLKSFASLGGMVTLRALDQAERTHEAMAARGYDGTLHLAPVRPVTYRQWVCLGAFFLLTGFAFVLIERWLA